MSFTQIHHLQSWLLFCLTFYFILQFINNDVFVTDKQQSDSVIPIQVFILFRILFPFRLLENIEPSSRYYTTGPCWLSILNTVVCTGQFQTPNLSSNTNPFPLVALCSFSKYASVSVLQISSFGFFFFFGFHVLATSCGICLCLIYFTQYDNLQVHLCCCKQHYFILCNV